MTDIVERLRAHKVGVRWKRGIDTDYPVEWEPHPLCSEAADEIERLRRDAERYRWLRSAYLRYRIACAERDAEMHDYHAAIEPLLAASARQQAEAWRVELAILTPARCAEH